MKMKSISGTDRLLRKVFKIILIKARRGSTFKGIGFLYIGNVNVSGNANIMQYKM